MGSWERELTPPEFFCREGHGGNGVCQRTCCVPELAEMNSGESARRCIPRESRTCGGARGCGGLKGCPRGKAGKSFR